MFNSYRTKMRPKHRDKKRIVMIKIVRAKANRMMKKIKSFHKIKLNRKKNHRMVVMMIMMMIVIKNKIIIEIKLLMMIKCRKNQNTRGKITKPMLIQYSQDKAY